MNENSRIDLYRERDMGQVIAVTSLLFRRHWKHMFRTIGLMTLPLFFMTSTLYFLLGNQAADASPLVAKSDVSTLNVLLMFLSGYITLTVLIWGCVYYLQLYEEKGPENFEMSDIWNKVFSSGWRLLPVYILYLALFALVSIPLVLSFITLILIPVSLFAWLFAYALLFFLPVVFLLENKGLFSSIGRGFALMKKNWFKAGGIVVCTFTVLFGFFFSPLFFGDFISLISDGYGLKMQELVAHGWFRIVVENFALGFSYIACFFLMITFTALYYSLVESRDKYSLKKRVEQLSVAEESGTYS